MAFGYCRGADPPPPGVDQQADPVQQPGQSKLEAPLPGEAERLLRQRGHRRVAAGLHRRRQSRVLDRPELLVGQPAAGTGEVIEHPLPGRPGHVPLQQIDHRKSLRVGQSTVGQGGHRQLQSRQADGAEYLPGQIGLQDPGVVKVDPVGGVSNQLQHLPPVPARHLVGGQADVTDPVGHQGE